METVFIELYESDNDVTTVADEKTDVIIEIYYRSIFRFLHLRYNIRHVGIAEGGCLKECNSQ